MSVYRSHAVSVLAAPHNRTLRIMSDVAERHRQPCIELLGEERSLAFRLYEVKKRIAERGLLVRSRELSRDKGRAFKRSFGH